MSSFVRRIQRQVMPSQAGRPPRKVFYMGRGDKLGVRNPKDASLLARLAREERWRAKRGEG